jgi:hypothetical protein
MTLRRRHLLVAGIIIAVGLVLLGFYFKNLETVKSDEQKCAAKGLEVFEIEGTQICRDHDTGLLYAP